MESGRRIEDAGESKTHPIINIREGVISIPSEKLGSPSSTSSASDSSTGRSFEFTANAASECSDGSNGLLKNDKACAAGNPKPEYKLIGDDMETHPTVDLSDLEKTSKHSSSQSVFTASESSHTSYSVSPSITWPMDGIVEPQQPDKDNDSKFTEPDLNKTFPAFQSAFVNTSTNNLGMQPGPELGEADNTSHKILCTSPSSSSSSSSESEPEPPIIFQLGANAADNPFIDKPVSPCANATNIPFTEKPLSPSANATNNPFTEKPISLSANATNNPFTGIPVSPSENAPNNLFTGKPVSPSAIATNSLFPEKPGSPNLKDSRLVSVISDDDIPVSSMPSNGQSPRTPTHRTELSSDSESATQYPPTQVMERPEDPNSSTYRIPSRVFSRTRSTAPMEWSVASNESLFSIHMGNMSFTREQLCWLGKSGELCRPGDLPMSPLVDVASNQPLIMKPSDNNLKGSHSPCDPVVTEATAAETMRQVILENSENQRKEGSTLTESSSQSASISHHSESSTKSFQFPILTGDGGKSMTLNVDAEKPKQQKQPESPRPPSNPQTPKEASEGKSPGDAPATGPRRWLACFSCCPFCS